MRVSQRRLDRLNTAGPYRLGQARELRLRVDSDHQLRRVRRRRAYVAGLLLSLLIGFWAGRLVQLGVGQ